MGTWIDRLHNEKHELAGRLDKLKTFLIKDPDIRQKDLFMRRLKIFLDTDPDIDSVQKDLLEKILQEYLRRKE